MNRRVSPLESVLYATTRTQSGALTFGCLGALLASPVPRIALDDVTPSSIAEDGMTGMMGNIYLSAGYFMLPWVSLLGYALLALAAGTLLIRGRKDTYRSVLRSRKHNDFAGLAMIVAIIAAFAFKPPQLGPSKEDMDIAMSKAAGENTSSVPMARTANIPQPEIGNDFPSNGTIQWGESQPIGGNLGTIDIWDLTGTPENKVVRLRGGLTMALPGAAPYATIYIRAGQHVRVTVPTSTGYNVVAIAGPTWLGPKERFGTATTTVDFGMVIPVQGRPQVIAMGAPDQEANVVPNNRF